MTGVSPFSLNNDDEIKRQRALEVEYGKAKKSPLKSVANFQPRLFSPRFLFDQQL